jgi:hypothetical protein
MTSKMQERVRVKQAAPWKQFRSRRKDAKNRKGKQVTPFGDVGGKKGA